MYSYNLTGGSLPSYYSSETKGYVTSIKKQGGGGNCWAFATIATLESCILKASGISKDKLDLSEENMKNIAELYSVYGWDAQTIIMQVSYLQSYQALCMFRMFYTSKEIAILIMI